MHNVPFLKQTDRECACRAARGVPRPESCSAAEISETGDRPKILVEHLRKRNTVLSVVGVSKLQPAASTSGSSSPSSGMVHSLVWAGGCSPLLGSLPEVSSSGTLDTTLHFRTLSSFSIILGAGVAVLLLLLLLVDIFAIRFLTKIELPKKNSAHTQLQCNRNKN